jgi:hypothetical protein
MKRHRRIPIVLAATCAALIALTATASAAKPSHKNPKQVAKPSGARLDPQFGDGGATKVSVRHQYERTADIALAPEGRAYVLRGGIVFAFEADGKPAKGFGEHGRLKIESASGEAEPAAIAVDSKGRVLVDGRLARSISGSGGPPFLSEAFVDRLLRNGRPDPGFGTNGETDTDFGLPHLPSRTDPETDSPAGLDAGKLTVDGHDRPIVGGSYEVEHSPSCFYPSAYSPYVGRLTTTGAVDTSFAGKGYVTREEDGSISALVPTPDGGVATLTRTATCFEHADRPPAPFTSYLENGEPNPGLDPARPSAYWSMVGLDPQSRALVVQQVDVDPFGPEEGLRLMRLLPNGDVDSTFGFGGGIPLQKPVDTASAAALDGNGRAILGRGKNLVRYTADGHRDWKFGPHGVLGLGKAGGTDFEVSDLAVDGRGRIYAAGLVQDSAAKSGEALQVVRILPGK